ncbi:P2X purinoceptor 4 [Halotydeus destructor]|nr:P2X purinoceptor 4 [Halotydeus destructor]
MGVVNFVRNYATEYVDGFWDYDSPKVVVLKNRKIGVIYRFLQLIILFYVIFYAIIYEKGYQSTSPIESAVSTKVKGVASTVTLGDDVFQIPIERHQLYRRPWDIADYQIPPSETNAFFVLTNVVITPNQTLGQCPESPDVEGAICQTDADCEPNKHSIGSDGPNTGKCVQPRRQKVATCEIKAWCPIEDDMLPLKGNKPLLRDVMNFTVLIKNTVTFTKYKVTRRNILQTSDKKFLANCNYGKYVKGNQHPLCPKFTLGDMIKSAGEDFDDMASKGGVMGILIDWKCNFDHDAEKCLPKYTFRRMDKTSGFVTAPGWNFRYATYHEMNRRTLFKAYGIRFLVMVNGQGGQFSILPLLLNIGSGLGLLAISKIICDVIAFDMDKNRDVYKENKFVVVCHDNLDKQDGAEDQEGAVALK